jgi:hypothetical protein
VNTLIKLGENSVNSAQDDEALSLFLQADEISNNPEVKAALAEMIAVISPEEALRRQETNQVIAEVRENQNQPTGSQNSDQTTGEPAMQGGQTLQVPFLPPPISVSKYLWTLKK